MKPNTQASAASRWMDCTASAIIDVSGLPPEKSSPEAERGKFLHGIGHACLSSGGNVSKDTTLQPEEAESVQTYVNYVRSRSGIKFYEVEGAFAGRRCFADSAVHKGDLLEIIDYKSGRNLVKPVENEQLMIYAFAVLDKFKILLDGFVKTVRLTIVQPTIEPATRSWDLSLEGLLLWRQQIEAKLILIAAGEVDFRPTDDNCYYCRAKTICPALDKKRDPAAFDSASLGGKMKAIPLMEKWIKAVKEDVAAVLESGKPVDGFKWVNGVGKRFWEDQKGAKAWLKKQGFKETDIFTPPVMITAPAAEKLIKGKGAQKKKDALGKFMGKALGKPTTAPDSDPRPPINRETEARKAFAGVLEKKK